MAAEVGTKAVSTFEKIGCTIDNMPKWAKITIGTIGTAVATVSGTGAAAVLTTVIVSGTVGEATDAAVLTTVIASGAVGAATDAAIYTATSLPSGRWNVKDFEGSVADGFINGYMFGGAAAGVKGIGNLVKDGRAYRFLNSGTGSASDTNVYYHVTTQDNAQKIIETSELRHGKYESRVFAWNRQPTKKQASIAGISSDAKTVIKFRSNAAFEPDIGNKTKAIEKMVVQTTEGQRVPISITDTEVVGFKKEWWKFWKK